MAPLLLMAVEINRKAHFENFAHKIIIPFTGSQQAYCVFEFAKSQSAAAVKKIYSYKIRIATTNGQNNSGRFRKFKKSRCLYDGQ